MDSWMIYELRSVKGSLSLYFIMNTVHDSDTIIFQPYLEAQTEFHLPLAFAQQVNNMLCELPEHENKLSGGQAGL
jgi:hypothetical protein